MKYVVTGTSSGLGYELTSCLLEHGEVIGISRRKNYRASSASSKYSHISVDLGELTEFQEVEHLSQRIRNILGDNYFTLILNAAQFYSGTKRLDILDVKTMFQVNFFSAIQLISALRVHNLRRVVIINSISGLIGQSSQHEYAASKHALMGYTRSLIKEAKAEPFDVICINPGGIDTQLWDNYPDINTSSFLQTKELANLLTSLITSKQRMFIESMQILPESDV